MEIGIGYLVLYMENKKSRKQGVVIGCVPGRPYVAVKTEDGKIEEWFLSKVLSLGLNNRRE